MVHKQSGSVDCFVRSSPASARAVVYSTEGGRPRIGHVKGHELMGRGTIGWPGVWRLVRLRVVVGGWDKPRGGV